MPADLVFYTNPMSRGQIVRWMFFTAGSIEQAVTNQALMPAQK